MLKAHVEARTHSVNNLYTESCQFSSKYPICTGVGLTHSSTLTTHLTPLAENTSVEKSVKTKTTELGRPKKDWNKLMTSNAEHFYIANSFWYVVWWCSLLSCSVIYLTAFCSVSRFFSHQFCPVTHIQVNWGCTCMSALHRTSATCCNPV